MSFDGWDIDFSLDETPSLSNFRVSDALVLSGGGMKGLYLLGSLEYLYTEVGFSHIKGYYGVSIGAVICVLLLLGYSPLEVMAQICVHKIPQKISVIDKNVIERKSLFDPKHFLEIFEEMIRSRVDTIPTLSEFFQKTQKDLYITTTCLASPYEPVYLHHSTHPDLSLSKAVHMSMSIPFAFGYAEYEGKKYVDGGLLDNFPILYASERAKRPFGICLSNRTETFDESSFMSEVLFILSLSMVYITEQTKKNCPKNAIFIELSTGEGVSGFFAFSRQNTAIYEMFSKGYQECKGILARKAKLD